MSLPGTACIAQSEAPSPPSPASFVSSPGENLCDCASICCSAGASSRSTDPSTGARADRTDEPPETTTPVIAAASRASANTHTASGRPIARRRTFLFRDISLPLEMSRPRAGPGAAWPAIERGDPYISEPRLTKKRRSRSSELDRRLDDDRAGADLLGDRVRLRDELPGDLRADRAEPDALVLQAELVVAAGLELAL